MASNIDFSARRGGLPRWAGGLLALIFPVVLGVLALSVSFRRVGDMTDVATSFLAAMVFLLAFPTAWVYSVDFIDAGRLLVVVSAMVTSLPLWYLLGGRIAENSNRWSDWIRRYAAACVVWSALNLALIVILGSL